MGANFSGKSLLEAFVHEKEVSVVLPVGTTRVNAFKVTGAVRVFNQWARITEITTLDNVTNVYGSFYDGSVNTPLTADGITLSNVGLGTYFTKDKLSTEPYSVVDGAAGGYIETLNNRDAGRPFTVVQKAGQDCFVCLNATAGGTEQSFKMVLHFEYRLLNGGSAFEFLL